MLQYYNIFIIIKNIIIYKQNTNNVYELYNDQNYYKTVSFIDIEKFLKKHKFL